MIRTAKKDWPGRFLEGLRRSANVSEACQAAGVSRRAAYDKRESDAEFASAWADALDEAADSLESEAWRRGRDGVDEPVVYQGELMGTWKNPDGTRAEPNAPGATFHPLTVKKYSDTMLIFMLKAARPEKYRERLTLGGTGKDGEIVVKVLGRGASTEEL